MKLTDIKKIAESSPNEFIQRCENDYHKSINMISDCIAQTKADRPILLISGPSGSGKTTSARMIERRLEADGHRVHSISMDNYFKPLTDEERILFDRHELDLESPDRVDKELLSENLHKLMRGIPVEIPLFNFSRNIRVHSGNTVQLKKGDMVIIEGIHSLNPALTGDSDDYTTRVYVSVRTRIEYEAESGEIEELHPSKIRLARRMLRDYRTRSREYIDSASIYESVERGEDLYIMPYKHRADFDINTFIPYELCVYNRLLPSRMPDVEEKLPQFTNLLSIMNSLPNIHVDDVPRDSLVREFIGGGIFKE